MHPNAIATRPGRGRARWPKPSRSGGRASQSHIRLARRRMEAAGVVSDRIRGASLPKARKWLVWLAYHVAELPAAHGWQALTRDTLIGLHHAIVSTARRLRGNPTWDIQGTMTGDTERLEDQAQRLVRLAGQLVLRPDIPERFRSLVNLLEGSSKPAAPSKWTSPWTSTPGSWSRWAKWRLSWTRSSRSSSETGMPRGRCSSPWRRSATRSSRMRSRRWTASSPTGA